ncbi:unnamed protein product [Rhizoctonia solani]|uniref:Demethylmenaquinone methyltransferase n=1 Tax=Rhizoctonia solani TaxID=456999 RepID=A0A8H2WY13_9AGAM|nr:unnamed protein product [Rhizoctonia solani]
MADPGNFDVWIWNSAHPEQPSRSRPNTRAPSKLARARRRKADDSPVFSSPESSFSSLSPSLLPLVTTLPKYNSTFPPKQNPNACTRMGVESTGSRSSLLQRLEKYSTGEILYALIILGLTQNSDDSPIQHGGLLPDVFMLSPLSTNPLNHSHRICGFAHTIEMAHPTESILRPGRGQHFFETASRESIIIASPSAGTQFAVWDKSMTINAKNQGVLGTIVNGLATDLAAHREVGFPVFSQGYSPSSQVITGFPLRTGVPVTFSPRSHFGTCFQDLLSAVKVFPGDVIVADVGGTVCVPFALAEEVLNLCSFQAQSTTNHTRGNSYY